MAFAGLKILLDQAINRAGLKGATDAAGVCDLWPKVISEKFGEEFGKKCEAIKFKDGVLSVRIFGSAFAQELELEKESVMDAINKKLGKNIVKRIKFEI